MKKRVSRSGGRGRAVAIVVAAVCLLLALQSCRHKPAAGRHSTDSHYAQVDSLVNAIGNVDSLAVLAKQYHSQNDHTGEMLALKRQGSLLRKQSRFEDAINVHTRGLNVATHVCDTIEMIAALNNIGTDYRRMSNLSTANGFHLQALKLCDTYSDKESSEAIKSHVITLNGLGNIEIELHDYAFADSLFRVALRGEERLDSKLGQAINYANIGAVKRALGDRDSAWYYYRKSLELNKIAGSQEGEALCHLHFGELYRDERSLSRAQEEYEIAYEKLKNLGESYHWLECCVPLASLCILLDEKDDARRYLQEAEDEARRINSMEHQADACWTRYELALSEGDAQQALDYYIKSKALYDSIYGPEKNEEMRRQRVDYANGIKRGELNSLSQDVTRLKRVRNMMGIFALLLFLMGAAIIVALVYVVRMRNRTQRRLRQVEETRSLFFTNVVHQLRTPLTAIMGATDNIVATSGSDAAAQRENVEIIERQGRNLLLLVDRILQVGGVRSALRDPEWRTGDAVTFVRMVVESYRDQCQERHIELTYAASEPSVIIETVPSYLKTILGSYIENAINYSKDFSKITVTSMVENDCFVVKVSDDGIGIAEADLPHVFEPFFRGAMAEHMVDGVGIGLTVARDMTMAMGGEVKASSGEGQGACFMVKLPLKHSDSQKLPIDYILDPVASMARRRQEYQEATVADGEPDGSLPTLLVVEDHADVAHLVGRTLDSHFSIMYASDGEQAMSLMRQLRPDIIITDVKMPRMGGHELCRRVRASSDLRAIPIIMLSARTSDADRVQGIEAGADAYLVKPFVREELVAWTHRLLDSHRVLQQEAEQARLSQPAAPPSTEAIAGEDLQEMDDTVFLERFRSEAQKQFSHGIKLDFDKIAMALKMGESKLRRRVLQVTGKSAPSYVVMMRMERAMDLLRTRPDLRIGDVAEQCGFMDVAYFSRVFRQQYGMTPTEARNAASN